MGRLIRTGSTGCSRSVTGVFLDTAAAGHPALVFAVTPSKILAFSKAPYSQTRYVS